MVLTMSRESRIIIIIMFWWGKLEGIGWEAVDWMNLAQVRNKRWAVVNMVMNLRLTCSADNVLPSRATASSAVQCSQLAHNSNCRLRRRP
jgi:hypothetical protein